MPIPMDNDSAALEAALNRTPDPDGIRMTRIVNTGSLETFWTTEAVLPELREREDIIVDETPLELTFSDEGRLLSMAKGSG
jgi:hypothetical protein